LKEKITFPYGEMKITKEWLFFNSELEMSSGNCRWKKYG